MEFVEKQTEGGERGIEESFPMEFFSPFFDNWENTLEESMGIFPHLIAVESSIIPQTTHTEKKRPFSPFEFLPIQTLQSKVYLENCTEHAWN